MSADHGLSNLFGYLGIRTLRGVYHILKFSLFDRLARRGADLYGFRLSDPFLKLVAYSHEAGGGGLTDGRRVEYVLRFPQIG